VERLWRDCGEIVERLWRDCGEIVERVGKVERKSSEEKDEGKDIGISVE
jgi:hypothetical protein